MKKISLIITMTFCAGLVYAQNSLLEDAEGEGSFKIYSNVISVNTGENAIKANVAFPNGTSTTPNTQIYPHSFFGIKLNSQNPIVLDYTSVADPNLIHSTPTYFNGDSIRIGDSVRTVSTIDGFGSNYGFTINAIATDGESSFLSDGKIDPKGEITGFYTFYGSNDNISAWDYITIEAGISAKDVSLVKLDSLFNDPKNETSLGYRVELNYNRVGSVGMSTTLFGVGLSYVGRDNSNQLSSKKYDITNTLATSGNLAATSQSSVQGYDFEQYKSNINTLNFNTDFGFYPRIFDDRLLIAAQSRVKFVQDVDPKWNMGIGFYLADEDVSTKIIGGINVIAGDITNKNNPFKEKISINLVAGFKLK